MAKYLGLASTTLTLLLVGCSAGGGGNGGTFNPGGSAGDGGASGDGGSAGTGSSSGSAGNGGSGHTKNCGQEGAISCNGKTAKVCDGEGEFKEQTECETLCVDGLGCRSCYPGSGTCKDGVSTYCNADGTAYEQEICDADMGLSCGSDGRCQGVCSRASLGSSYIGCEYFPTVTSNAQLYAGFSFAVVVSNTGSAPANVRINKGGSSVVQRLVQPGAVEVIQLPWVNALRGTQGNYQSALVTGGAYQLKSDQPITVYQFNPLEFELSPKPSDCSGSAGNDKCNSFTNDASLLLPSNTMTREYIVASSATIALRLTSFFGTSITNLPGLVSITGTQPDTTVTVQLAGDIRGGSGVQTMKQGQTQSFKLGVGDVLQLMSADAKNSDLSNCKSYPDLSGGSRELCAVPARLDLTGSIITSDKAVQVIGGHDCTFMPYSEYACDHIEESLFPLSTWGKEVLVTAPHAVSTAASGDGKADKQVVRVISGADGNQIELDPPLFPGGVLNKGQYADVQLTNTDFKVKGSGPLLVVQYLVGGSVADANSTPSKGDPSMSLGVPSAQFRTSYSFLAPSTYTYNFVNIIAPTGVAVMLDGKAVTAPTFPVGGSGFSVARVPIQGGAHSVHSDKPFGIVVYGYGAYTSYMYPGGLDLQTLVPPIIN